MPFFAGCSTEPEPAEVLGLDLSHWNGAVDFEKAKAAGIKFVILKATQGTWYTDTAFCDNYAAAKAAGLLVGVYHFLDWSDYGAAQAAYFFNAINGLDLDLPPAIDYECAFKSGIATTPFPDRLPTRDEAVGELADMASGLLDHGHQPMLYTSLGYWQEYGDGDALWTAFPLWLAQYRQESDIEIPAPWKEWVIWQYSNTGEGAKYGTQSAAVDLNRWHGTLAELREFCE